MEYDAEHIHEDLELIEVELERINERRKAFEGMRAQLEELLRLISNDDRQLPLLPPSNERTKQSTPKGKISYKNGLVAVLRDAKGELLETKEIWRRMQLKGVVSDSPRATNFISMNAKGIGEIEKVGTNQYRWIGP